MIVISHRGNLCGADPNSENHPDTVDQAIAAGFDVEVDLWLIDNQWWLGHDRPQYAVDWQWLMRRRRRLWAHTKNLTALTQLNQLNSAHCVHYFWHQQDTVTLTSQGFVWAFPAEITPANAIAVMPEIKHGDLSCALGVCTDYPREYL